MLTPSLVCGKMRDVKIHIRLTNCMHSFKCDWNSHHVIKRRYVAK